MNRVDELILLFSANKFDPNIISIIERDPDILDKSSEKCFYYTARCTFIYFVLNNAKLVDKIMSENDEYIYIFKQNTSRIINLDLIDLFLKYRPEMLSRLTFITDLKYIHLDMAKYLFYKIKPVDREIFIEYNISLSIEKFNVDPSHELYDLNSDDNIKYPLLLYSILVKKESVPKIKEIYRNCLIVDRNKTIKILEEPNILYTCIRYTDALTTKLFNILSILDFSIDDPTIDYILSNNITNDNVIELIKIKRCNWNLVYDSKYDNIYIAVKLRDLFTIVKNIFAKWRKCTSRYKHHCKIVNINTDIRLYPGRGIEYLEIMENTRVGK